MQQASDFLVECDAVCRLLSPLSENDFASQTQFKGWTINQIIQHLLFFDRLAAVSVTDEGRSTFSMLRSMICVKTGWP